MSSGEYRCSSCKPLKATWLCLGRGDCPCPCHVEPKDAPVTRNLLTFTHNAVERFQLFYAPHLNYDAARVLLETCGLDARSTKQKAAHGDAVIWEVPGADFRSVENPAEDKPSSIHVIVKRKADDDPDLIVVGVIPPTSRFTTAQVQALEDADNTANAAVARAQGAVSLAADQRKKAPKEKRASYAHAQEVANKTHTMALLERAVVHDVLKTARTEMVEMAEQKKLRCALRIAVNELRNCYLDGLPPGDEGLDRIHDVDPGFLSDEFLQLDPSFRVNHVLPKKQHLKSAATESTVDKMRGEQNPPATGLKKFTAQIREPMVAEPDDFIQQYADIEALDARAAAICARDRFENAGAPTIPTMYIVRVWQDFPVEVETRRVARLAGEE